MIRLTKKEASGKWQVRGISWEALNTGRTITPEMNQRLYGCLCKLKDYEDSGLAPDQMQSLLYQISDAGAYVCDTLCRYPHEATDQEELDGICEDCQMGVCRMRVQELAG